VVLEDVGGEGWFMVLSFESLVWGGVGAVEGGRFSLFNLVEVDV